MQPYATPTELQAWLPAASTLPQDDAEQTRLLARATDLIAERAVAGYAVTDTGAPADPDVAGALSDATCAQVEGWLETGEENAVAGYPRGTSISGGGLSVSALPDVLAPRAAMALDRVGLRTAWAW